MVPVASNVTVHIVVPYKQMPKNPTVSNNLSLWGFRLRNINHTLLMWVLIHKLRRARGGGTAEKISSATWSENKQNWAWHRIHAPWKWWKNRRDAQIRKIWKVRGEVSNGRKRAASRVTQFMKSPRSSSVLAPKNKSNLFMNAPSPHTPTPCRKYNHTFAVERVHSTRINTATYSLRTEF